MFLLIPKSPPFSSDLAFSSLWNKSVFHLHTLETEVYLPLNLCSVLNRVGSSQQLEILFLFPCKSISVQSNLGEKKEEEKGGAVEQAAEYLWPGRD